METHAKKTVFSREIKRENKTEGELTVTISQPMDRRFILEITSDGHVGSMEVLFALLDFVRGTLHAMVEAQVVGHGAMAGVQMLTHIMMKIAGLGHFSPKCDCGEDDCIDKQNES